MKTAKLAAAVQSVLKTKARAGQTTKVEATLLVMNRIDKAGGPTKFGIGAAALRMALSQIVTTEVSRQLKSPLSEHAETAKRRRAVSVFVAGQVDTVHALRKAERVVTMTIAENRRYTFKLYPSAEQAATLHNQRQMMVDLWNALLQRREDVYSREKRTLTRFDLEYEITALYRECPEWRELSTWCGRRVNVALANAFDAFFRRVKQGAGASSGYPRYKRRRDGDRIPHRCASGCRLSPRETSDGANDPGSARNWRLYLKGVPGLIHARGIFPLPPDKMTDADVLWRDGRWWFSVCTEIQPRRINGREPVVIKLGVVDGLAEVNGEIQIPPEMVTAQLLQDRLDTMKSDRDSRWSKRAPADADWIEANQEIGRLAARIARKRANALHVWSARLINRARDITIIKPPIKEHTATPRGDQKRWGANVETVSTLNRDTLSKAPAMAAAMLQYKAAEAGIRCDVVTDTNPEIAIGEKLVSAGKALRKAKRALRHKGNHNEHHQQGTRGPRRGDRGGVGTGAGSAQS